MMDKDLAQFLHDELPEDMRAEIHTPEPPRGPDEPSFPRTLPWTCEIHFPDGSAVFHQSSYQTLKRQVSWSVSEGKVRDMIEAGQLGLTPASDQK